jgi:transcriptional regulator with XRE-family HTH domain
VEALPMQRQRVQTKHKSTKRRRKRSFRRPARRGSATSPARDQTAPAGLATLGIGGRLRHARLARGATLKDVARAAGCSESLVSKIETDKINPSLKVLHRICEALKVTIGVVTRAGHRVTVEFDSLRRGTGLRMERLVPHAKGHLLQGSVHVIAPGGSTDGVVSHQGEEVGYVIEGELDLTVGKRTYRVRAGDSFCYRSDEPHGYRNVGSTEARVVIVNTPPSF